MSEFRLPSLGADMEAGTLLEWKIHPGDHVHRGDIAAVVETDKGAIEIEVFADGDVEALLIEPGTRVPVGTPIALIDGKEHAAPSVAPSEAAKPAPPEKEAVKPAPAPPAEKARAAPGVKAVPAARKRAQELGVKLEGLKGTGEGGAVTKADVERAAAPAAPADRHAAMRRAIAAAMTKANQEIPHYYLEDTLDMEPALARLAEENARRPLAERVLHGVVLLRAVARAAREFPEFNGVWTDGGFSPAEHVNLGVVIALRKGGVVNPAILDCDRKSLTEIMVNLSDIIRRAREGAGSLRSSEVTDVTLTVTNLGDLGVESVYGVIYPPQVALVGFGTIVERPWVVDGVVRPRKVCRMTLAGDHRASDGLRGAQFMAAVKRRLQTELDEVFA